MDLCGAGEFPSARYPYYTLLLPCSMPIETQFSGQVRFPRGQLCWGRQQSGRKWTLKGPFLKPAVFCSNSKDRCRPKSTGWWATMNQDAGREESGREGITGEGPQRCEAIAHPLRAACLSNCANKEKERRFHKGAGILPNKSGGEALKVN